MDVLPQEDVVVVAATATVDNNDNENDKDKDDSETNQARGSRKKLRKKAQKKRKETKKVILNYLLKWNQQQQDIDIDIDIDNTDIDIATATTTDNYNNINNKDADKDTDTNADADAQNKPDFYQMIQRLWIKLPDKHKTHIRDTWNRKCTPTLDEYFADRGMLLGANMKMEPMEAMEAKEAKEPKEDEQEEQQDLVVKLAAKESAMAEQVQVKVKVEPGKEEREQEQEQEQKQEKPTMPLVRVKQEQQEQEPTEERQSTGEETMEKIGDDSEGTNETNMTKLVKVKLEPYDPDLDTQAFHPDAAGDIEHNDNPGASTSPNANANASDILRAIKKEPETEDKYIHIHAVAIKKEDGISDEDEEYHTKRLCPTDKPNLAYKKVKVEHH